MELFAFGIPAIFIVWVIIMILNGLNKNNAITNIISSPSSLAGMEKQVFNEFEIYYSDQSLGSIVTQLGNYLVQSGFTQGQQMVSKLIINDEQYEFHYMVKKGMDQDPEYIQIAKNFAAAMSKDVFGGVPVDIHLCDDSLNTLRVAVSSLITQVQTAPAEEWMMMEFHKTELYYHNTVTQPEAQLLGNYLIQSGFADGNPKAVQLIKNESYFTFRFITSPDIYQDPDSKDLIKPFSDELSSAVFGGNRVDIHLCDQSFASKLEHVGTTTDVGEQSIQIKEATFSYSSAITDDEAKRVVSFLDNIGFTESEGPESFQKIFRLDKNRNIFQFQWVLPPVLKNNPEAQQQMKEIAFALSKLVFNEANVEVHICDENFNTHATFSPPKEIVTDCPYCKNKGAISSEKVLSVGVETACPNCKKVFIVTPVKSIPMENQASPSSEEVSGTKECPMCAEAIMAKAKICRFCRYEYTEEDS
jgi:hypothetical protein